MELFNRLNRATTCVIFMILLKNCVVISGLRCHVCDLSLSEVQCASYGIQTCSGSEDSCETEIRVVSTNTFIAKRCKQSQACQNNALGNAQNCPGNNDSPFCFYCCLGDECNAIVPSNPLLDTSFCDGKAVGMYGDPMDTDCRSYYSCTLSQPFHVHCQAGTRWRQDILFCDSEANVDCNPAVTPAPTTTSSSTTTPVVTSSCSLTDPVMDLNSNAGGYLTLFVNMRLDGCVEFVRSWEYFARRTGVFYATLWKETSTSNEFQLLGSNRIQVTVVGKSIYEVAEGDQLSVSDGTFLGIAYESSVILGVIPYEDSQFPSTDSSLSLYTVHNSDTRMDTLTVGSTVSGIVDPSQMKRSPALKPKFDADTLASLATTSVAITTSSDANVGSFGSFTDTLTTVDPSPSGTTSTPTPCAVAFTGGYRTEEEAMVAFTGSDLELFVELSPSCVQTTITWSVENATDAIVYTESKTTSQLNYLSIPNDVVGQGIYRVSVTITDYGNPTATMYFKVIGLEIPLVPVLVGGSFVTASSRTRFCLDGYTNSYDPLVKNKQDKSGLEYIWACSIKSTNLPCGPLWERCESLTVGHLCCNTTGVSLDTYRFTLGLKKDTRAAETSQDVRLIQGYTPNTEIRCVVNCNPKTMTAFKVSFVAHYEDNFNEIFTSAASTWRLFVVDSSGTRTEESGLESISDTGVHHAELVLLPNTLSGGHRYCVELTTTCPSCETAIAEYCFYTNLPPRAGSCQVTPLQGIALETEFYIQCSGWQDEGYSLDFNSITSSVPMVYKYHVIKDNSTALMYCGENPNSFPLTLLSGDTQDQYKLPIVVEIYDVYGDFTTQTLEVKVLPNSYGQLTHTFHNTLGSNAEWTISGLSTILLQQLQVFTIQLNTEHSVSAAALNTNDAMQMRESVASAALDLSTNMTSSCHCQQVAELLTSLTVHRREVNKAALKYSSAALSNSLKFAGTYLKDYPEESVRIGIVLVEAVGMVLEAAVPVYNASHYPMELDTVESRKEKLILQEQSDLSPEESAFFKHQDYKMEKWLWEKEQRRAESVVPQVHTAEKLVVDLMAGTLLTYETPVTFMTPSSKHLITNMPISELQNASFIDGDVTIEVIKPHLNHSFNCAKLLKMAHYDRNPFIWGHGGDDIHSSVHSVRMEPTPDRYTTSADCDFNPGLLLTFPTRDVSHSNVSHNVTFTQDTLFYHKFYLNSTHTALVINIVVPENISSAQMYIRTNEYPMVQNYDQMFVIEAQSSGDGSVLKLFVPHEQLNGVGTYYLGFHPVIGGNSRKRRSTDGGYNHNNYTENVSMDYEIAMVTVGCMVMDDQTYQWDSERCQVDPQKTTLDTVACRCPTSSSQNTYGSLSIAPPNMIDFYTVWEKFEEIKNNIAVFSVVIATLLLYSILLIWARVQDKKDIAWHQMQPLMNNPQTKHQYIMTVDTGFSPNSGTKSIIHFILIGTQGNSGRRTLVSEDTEYLSRSGRKVFLLTTKGPLRQLESLKIWHDNSGPGSSASWYLNKITIDDCQADKQYVFQCNKWFAVEKGDGLIYRELHVSPKAEVCKFGYIFKENSKLKFTDGHLWTSVFFRPVASSFTRVQRLSCCVSFLFLVMICSAMFYQTEEGVERPQILHLGPLVLSVQEVLRSFISTLIVFPVHILTVLIFRNTNLNKNAVAIKGKTYMPDKKQPRWMLTKSYLFKSDSLVEEKVKKGKDGSYYEPRADTNGSRKPWHKGLLVLGWVLVFLSIVPSAFVIILYSMEWGAEKSNQWLTSFFLSFFEELLVFDPIKVFVSALTLAFIIKKATEVSLVDLGLDSKSESSQKPVKLGRGQKEAYLHQSVRERLVRERQARAVIREVIATLLFTLVVYSLCYASRNENSFQVHDNIKNILVKGKTGFARKVSSTKAYYDWFHNIFIPNYFPEHDELGNRYHWRERQFMSDLSSYRVGPARLRQLRANTVECKLGIISSRKCAKDYKSSEELTGPFGLGLLDEDNLSPDILSQDAWKYTHSSTVKGTTHDSELNSYGGGGYIAELSINANISIKIVDELRSDFWIDRHTRAVFLEFLLYNPNVNLFAVVKLLAEYPITGGVVTSHDICVLRTYIVGFLGVFMRICQVLFLVLVTYIAVILVISVVKFKTSPFSRITLFVDALIIISSAFMVVVYILRDINVAEAMYFFRQDASKTIYFSHVVIFDYLYNYALAFLSLFSSLKFMFLLRLNERFSRLGATLQHSAKPVLGFLMQAAVAYIAFGCIFYLWYGNYVYQFATFTRTSGSMLSFCLGKFDILGKLMNLDMKFTSVFFLSYLILSNWILVNLLIAVIVASHHEFKHRVTLHPKDHELVGVILTKLYKVLNKIIKH